MSDEKKNGGNCCSEGKCCCAKKLMCLIMAILIFTLGYFVGKLCGSYCPMGKHKMCPIQMQGSQQ